MIVIVKLAGNGQTKRFKKCMIRDRVFIEVDEDNRKIRGAPQLNLRDIDSVVSIRDNTFQAVPVNEWLEEFQSTLAWGSVA
jgi:hypothetical protein